MNRKYYEKKNGFKRLTVSNFYLKTSLSNYIGKIELKYKSHELIWEVY